MYNLKYNLIILGNHMYGLILIWMIYFYWYLCIIIDPKSFNRISDKTLEQQEISSDSKLRFIYFNKKAFPQLRYIAIEAIIFFLLNIIYTIVVCILFLILRYDLILERISFGYILLFMIITNSTIAIMNLKK